MKRIQATYRQLIAALNVVLANGDDDDDAFALLHRMALQFAEAVNDERIRRLKAGADTQ
jgi:hypothetical protein